MEQHSMVTVLIKLWT